MSAAVDPVWEEKYARGHAQAWPWDVVVSFVFRHAPRGRPRGEVRIFEVGFGTGANLWFAAREGFAVAGVEGSASAVARAQARFAADGLAGDLHVGDLSAPLAAADASVDMVIDRAGITYVGREAGRRTIAEVARILRPGGRFLFSPYSADHPGRRLGRPGPDDTVVDIAGGPLAGTGALCFYDEAGVRAALAPHFDLLSLRHVRSEELLDAGAGSAEWYAVGARRA